MTCTVRNGYMEEVGSNICECIAEFQGEYLQFNGDHGGELADKICLVGAGALQQPQPGPKGGGKLVPGAPCSAAETRR